MRVCGKWCFQPWNWKFLVSIFSDGGRLEYCPMYSTWRRRSILKRISHHSRSISKWHSSWKVAFNEFISRSSSVFPVSEWVISCHPVSEVYDTFSPLSTDGWCSHQPPGPDLWYFSKDTREDVIPFQVTTWPLCCTFRDFRDSGVVKQKEQFFSENNHFSFFFPDVVCFQDTSEQWNMVLQVL